MTHCVCAWYFRDFCPFISFNYFTICYVHHLGLYCLLCDRFLIAKCSFAVDKVVIKERYYYYYYYYYYYSSDCSRN